MKPLSYSLSSFLFLRHYKSKKTYSDSTLRKRQLNVHEVRSDLPMFKGESYTRCHWAKEQSTASTANWLAHQLLILRVDIMSV